MVNYKTMLTMVYTA